jgi:TatD DNase family protein
VNRSIIDSHIHFDQYSERDRQLLLEELEKHSVDALVSVSTNLSSAIVNRDLALADARIKPAYGFHPEQALPSEIEVSEILSFCEKHAHLMIAVGEVGLPYYSLKENPEIHWEHYCEILEVFIQLSAKLNKPVILHAVYEDAAITINLLEKYSIQKAHFHWFKGPKKTVERMIENGYSISITPDCLYEPEIQELIKVYPLSQMMVETDGPWPFEGIFTKKMTHPKMIHHSITQISALKKRNLEDVYRELYQNTKKFYKI